MDVDAVCIAICYADGGLSVEPDVMLEDSDAFSKFQTDSQLAGIIGWTATEGFARETAQLDARAAAILKNRAAPAHSEWDAPLIDDAHILAKRYTAGIHSGKKAARIEKSANGLWTLEYDERGELIRGYAEDEAA